MAVSWCFWPKVCEVQLPFWASHEIFLSLHFLLYEMEMVKLALQVKGGNVGNVPDT